MFTTLDKESISSFLILCKKEINKGHCQFVLRNININGQMINSKQALIDLGISKIEHIWNYVLELEVEDCIKIDFDYNPKRDMNSEIYVFKKEILNKVVYIKLTYRNIGIVCISFHESY